MNNERTGKLNATMMYESPEAAEADYDNAKNAEINGVLLEVAPKLLNENDTKSTKKKGFRQVMKRMGSIIKLSNKGKKKTKATSNKVAPSTHEPESEISETIEDDSSVNTTEISTTSTIVNHPNNPKADKLKKVKEHKGKKVAPSTHEPESEISETIGDESSINATEISTPSTIVKHPNPKSDKWKKVKKYKGKINEVPDKIWKEPTLVDLVGLAPFQGYDK
jgi:archaellum component FlaG (FlaF/FlaG flagellin family)